MMSREKALALLLKYNKEKFHIQHALTVEAVMRWYAGKSGYDADYLETMQATETTVSEELASLQPH